VALETTWRGGRPRVNLAFVVNETGPLPRLHQGLCLHQVRTSQLPLSSAVYRRICHDHRSGLGASLCRCKADATGALQRRLRKRNLPVRILTTPPNVLPPRPLGSSGSTSIAAIVAELQHAMPGTWLVHGRTKPLPVSHCPLNDVGESLPAPPPGAVAWHVRATLESERAELSDPAKRRRRLDKLAMMADPQNGAYEAERLVAERLLGRETARLARARPPIEPISASSAP